MMNFFCFLILLLLGLPLAALAQQPKSAATPAEQQAQVRPAHAAGQNSNSAQQSAPAPRHTEAPRGAAAPQSSRAILLSVVVTDRAGHRIAGLNQSDFTLLDNKHPEQIAAFQAFDTARPGPQPVQQIVLIIDAVNVDFQQVSYSRIGIDRFLRANNGRLPVPMSIYWYTEKGLEDAEAPSRDGNLLARKLDADEGRLRLLDRAAGAWGAVERFQASVQMLTSITHALASQPGRKLLIWIGPGWPMLDNPGLQMDWKQMQQLFGNIVDLSTAIRQAHLSIYSVRQGVANFYSYQYERYLKGVKNPSQVYLTDLNLKVLAVQSGGLVMSPNNDLAGQIEDCVQDTSAWYTMVFFPPPAGGPNEYHELKVRVDKPGLTARTYTGYYDQPEKAQKQ